MNDHQADGQVPRGRLGGEAVRLLQGLAAAGAYAVADPTDAGAVVLRVVKDGVSVGGGRFSRAAAGELVAHDLAGERAGGRRLRISAAGEAHLRRRAATPDEGFQAQHRDLADGVMRGEEGPVRVRLNAAESPLDWLRRRRDRAGAPLIDAASHEAGERLRRDLTAALMLPSVTLNWQAPAVDGGRQGSRDPGGASDAVIAARQRVTKALDAVGPDFAGLLVDLCGFLKGLERIEHERDWPPRSAKVVAKLALARLADHYGLERAATGPAASRGIRAWRAVVLEGDGAG